MKRKWFKFFTLLGFAQMVVVNSLANIVPINGMTTGDLSDQLKTNYRWEYRRKGIQNI